MKSTDKNYFINRTFNRLKTRCKSRNLIISITLEDFINQYESQSNLCFYTGEKMISKISKGRNRKSLSVDKIIPSLGYINGNVVFCCNVINACKSDLNLIEIKDLMPIFYDKIENHFAKNNCSHWLNIGNP